MDIERYRTDYMGEYVVIDTIFKEGKKEQIREWVDNPITNQHMGRATCIADGPSITNFPLRTLENHQGGLLASKAMQIYGVDNMHEKLLCNFLICTNQDELDKIIEQKYQENSIVYTTATLCIKNQGEFYLIPHGAKTPPHAVAVWLACFDGHREIFLFGYDEYTTEDEDMYMGKMVYAVSRIMKIYSGVQFYYVTDGREMPEAWKYNLNVAAMPTRAYVSYTDTGTSVIKSQPK